MKINKKSKILKRNLTRNVKLDASNKQLIQFDNQNNIKK
jgi:hypothetical protein